MFKKIISTVFMTWETIQSLFKKIVTGCEHAFYIR